MNSIETKILYAYASKLMPIYRDTDLSKKQKVNQIYNLLKKYDGELTHHGKTEIKIRKSGIALSIEAFEMRQYDTGTFIPYKQSGITTYILEQEAKKLINNYL